MPCGTILFQTTKILCTANVSNFLRRTVGCARMHMPDTPRWPRDWYLSLENKSQSACLVKHTAQARSVPLRNSVQVSVVCRLCVPLHRASDTQERSLDARENEARANEYHVFEHRHILRQDCSRLYHRRLSWCEETACSLSQLLTPPMNIRLSSLWKRQLLLNSNGMSTIASLIISLRLFDNALTKP